MHLKSGAAKRRAKRSIVEIGAMATAAIAVIDRFASACLFRGETNCRAGGKKVRLLRQDAEPSQTQNRTTQKHKLA
jgi:hypothetical protein